MKLKDHKASDGSSSSHMSCHRPWLCLLASGAFTSGDMSSFSILGRKVSPPRCFCLEDDSKGLVSVWEKGVVLDRAIQKPQAEFHHEVLPDWERVAVPPGMVHFGWTHWARPPLHQPWGKGMGRTSHCWRMPLCNGTQHRPQWLWAKNSSKPSEKMPIWA